MSDTGSVVFWNGVFFLAALFVVPSAVYAARRLRRRLQAHQRPPAFTLEDLRQMRARGQISRQEFEAMRAALLQQFAGRTSQPAGGKRAAGDRSPGQAPGADR